MRKVPMVRVYLICLGLLAVCHTLYAANSAAASNLAQNMADHGMSLWQLIVAGGSCMILLGMVSVFAVASIIYHFIYVTDERLTPPEFSENLLFLIQKKEYDKAMSVCRQQENVVSQIALQGLLKIPRGKSVVEEALQYEGRSQIEKMWRNLSYLGDAAVIAPMIGLLGTILGMIQAFNYQAFKAGIIKPIILAQGLAKAMITTAFGLIIAVPVLIFYSYFRGRISNITQTSERISSEILHTIYKQNP